jgi:hypothetical protein
MMMGTEMVPETSVNFNQLTLLIAREYFIYLRRCESFKSSVDSLSENFGKSICNSDQILNLTDLRSETAVLETQDAVAPTILPGASGMDGA